MWYESQVYWYSYDPYTWSYWRLTKPKTIQYFVMFKIKLDNWDVMWVELFTFISREPISPILLHVKFVWNQLTWVSCISYIVWGEIYLNYSWDSYESKLTKMKQVKFPYVLLTGFRLLTTRPNSIITKSKTWTRKQSHIFLDLK